MSCPNCSCHTCVEERQQYTAFRPVRTVYEPECAYERVAREYAARGETVPSSLLLYCGCSRCSAWC
jgi:hypothetical protein